MLDADDMAEMPADGETMGEIMFRGNIVMKGYLKNPKATAKAFDGGWFHTGDLAVMEPDRYVKIKDRSKDIIISRRRKHQLDRGRGRAVPPPRGAGLRRGGAAGPEVGRNAGGLCRSSRQTPRSVPPIWSRIARACWPATRCRSEIRFEAIPKTSTGKIQKFMLRERAKSAKAID